MTTVHNKYIEAYDIYCGRPTIYGNPYEIGKDGSRDEVIDRYKIYFNAKIQDPIFQTEVLKLKDKRLGCFCKPKRCHVDIIADYLNSLEE